MFVKTVLLYTDDSKCSGYVQLGCNSHPFETIVNPVCTLLCIVVNVLHVLKGIIIFLFNSKHTFQMHFQVSECWQINQSDDGLAVDMLYLKLFHKKSAVRGRKRSVFTDGRTVTIQWRKRKLFERNSIFILFSTYGSLFSFPSGFLLSRSCFNIRYLLTQTG